MRKTHITGIILTVVIIVLLYGFLGIQPLYLEEQRRAVVAQEMLFSGDYVVPTIYGELYHKKPPVWNWILLASFHIFGNQSEFTLRFFAVLSFILSAILVFIITRKHFGERTAWPAALLYLVSADLFLYFSLTAEIDLFYSLLIFGMIALIHPLYHRKRWLLLYSAVYFIGGIAFLTKGMPTLVFIALSLGTLFLMEKDFRGLFRWQHFAGATWFFLLVGGYIYLYSRKADPVDLLQVLWTESSQRTATEMPAGSFVRHLFIFPLELLKNLLPASLLIIVWMRHFRSLSRHPYLRYLLLITAVNILVYWVSPGARPRYTYMFYPILVILLVAGYELVKEQLNREQRILSIGIHIFTVLLGLGLVLLPFLPQASILPNRLAASAAGLLIAGAGYWIFMRKTQQPLFFLVIIMIALRLVVNLSWTMHRASEDNPVMVEKFSGEYLASLAGRGADLHVLGESDIPLRVAYYTYRISQKPFILDRRPQPSVLYLCDSLQASRQESLEIFKTLPLQDGREMYLGVVPER